MLIKLYIKIRHLQLQDIKQFKWIYMPIVACGTEVDGLIDNEFKQAIGRLSLSSFSNCAYAYFMSEMQGIPNEQNKRLFHDSTGNLFFHLTGYMQFLWFVKDNSVSTNEVFSTSLKDGKQDFLSVSNTEYPTKSTGQFTDSYFTKDELIDAATIYTQYQRITSKLQPVIDSPDMPNDGKTHDLLVTAQAIGRDYNNMPLIERGLMFIFSARATPLLPNKLAFYIQALECMFVPDGNAELQFRLSLRVAHYVGTQNKTQISDLIIRAYKIRSAYVHGDTTGKDDDYLKLLCLQVDHLCRKIFTQIITKDHRLFDTSTKKIKDELIIYLNQLTLK